MARHPRKRQDPQCDPFNAGEPVLPWEDPEAMHDDGCAYVEGADNYEAPSYEQPSYEAPTTDAPAVERPEKPVSPSPARPSRPAHKPSAEVAGGSTARAGSRVMRLAIAIVLIMSAFGCVAEMVGNVVDSVTSGLPGFFEEDSGTNERLDAVSDYAMEQSDRDAETCQQIVDERLKDTEALKAVAAEAFDERLEELVDRDADELGLDAAAYAEWAVANTRFSPSTVYCFLNYGDADPYGNAYVDVVTPGRQAMSDFEDELLNYFADQGLFGSYGTDEDEPALTEEQKQHVRELLSEAQAQAVATSEQTMIALDLVSDDGTWAINEDGLASEMNWLFSL